MTEVLHYYENALAKRVHGILNMWLFNTKPPHTAFGYTTPAAAHSQSAAA